MSRQRSTDFEKIAVLVAEGDAAGAAVALRALLDLASGARTDPRLARLRRETIEHQAAANRLRRDERGEMRVGTDMARAHARICAAILDMTDEIAMLVRGGRLAELADLVKESPQAGNEADLSGTDGVSPLARAIGPPGTSSYIFLSYAREDRATVLEIADMLRRRHSAVWFDAQIAGGSRFQDEIVAKLDGAAAAVVLWSEVSIRSDWVRWEADRAHRADKLVPVRVPSLPVEHVPPPYAAVLSVIEHGDAAALLQALSRFA